LLLIVAIVCPATTVLGDYALYTIPGTQVSLLLSGKTNYNAGGTVTHVHPRGTLYFNSRDIQVLKIPTPEVVYAKRLRDVTQSKDVDETLELAQWALQNGMLDQSKKLLGAAWKIDSTNLRLQKLAGLMRYINATVPSSSEGEAMVREFTGGRNMTATRSKHFLLLHDNDPEKDPVTKKTRAEMRLELLETVYESYFLTFAFRGAFLRPPTEPLNVVLFSRHADFMQMERRLGGSLRQTAGFYLPKDNISMFYDSGTSPQFQALMQLNDSLEKAREEAKKNRVANAGEIIRLAKTLELLIDITRESEDVSVVSHEAVHHLAANTNLFPRDSAFVRWVHEGLASYFESAKMAKWSGVGVVDQDRIGYYRVLEGDPVRGGLEFIVSDLGFVVEESLGNQLPAYGQAWAMTHFLFDRHFDQLMQFYKKIGALEDFAPNTTLGEKGELLLKIFDEIFGDRATLELEWRKYMRGLRTDMERLAEEID
jgi:hypothetical protein